MHTDVSSMEGIHVYQRTNTVAAKVLHVVVGRVEKSAATHVENVHQVEKNFCTDP